MWTTGRMLASNFEQLSRIIEQMRAEDFSKSSEAVLISEWKHQYTVVCDAVRRWNTCFDGVLLIQVCHAVIETVCSSFYMADQLFNSIEMIAPPIISCALNLVFLWITCYVAHSIYYWSEDVARALIRLECRLARPNPLIDQLAKHVIQSRPKVSAGGYFEIQRSLFPAVKSHFTIFITN